MKKLFSLAMMLLSFSLLVAAQEVAFNWPYKVVNGTIVTETPALKEGQQTALGLTTPKLPVVRVGFVGLGMRGPDAVRR